MAMTVQIIRNLQIGAKQEAILHFCVSILWEYQYSKNSGLSLLNFYGIFPLILTLIKSFNVLDLVC